MANLDRNEGSCNTLVCLSNRIYISNKTRDVNLKLLNMITKINEFKSILKHISCDFKCIFDGKMC